MYLTTTDDVVRARGTSLNLFLNVTDTEKGFVFLLGILLLAEMLDYLKSKPLDNAVVKSLVGFFTAKLVI